MGTAWPRSLLIVGCGNMGGAMLEGWLASGFDPAAVTVADPLCKAVPAGVTLLRSVPEGQFDAIVIGVKPQALNDVAPQLAAAARRPAVILSIMAGVELSTLAERFPEAAGVVRIMPNLAAAIRKSPMALAERGLDETQRQALAGLMERLGTPEWIDESLFDLVTALAGSGPAFVYRFIDALAGGAVQLGLDRGQAERLALATVEGASLLAAASDAPPGDLARRVASPGGTTEAGLRVLDADGALEGLVRATLEAASERGAQIARQARN